MDFTTHKGTATVALGAVHMPAVVPLAKPLLVAGFAISPGDVCNGGP